MTDALTSAMILKTAAMAIQTIVMAYALIKFVLLSRKWRKESEDNRRRYIAYRWEAMEMKHRMEAEQSAREIESMAGVEAADKFYASVMSVYDDDKTDKPKRKRKHDEIDSSRLLSIDEDVEIAQLPMEEAMRRHPAIWISLGGTLGNEE